MAAVAGSRGGGAGTVCGAAPTTPWAHSNCSYKETFTAGRGERRLRIDGGRQEVLCAREVPPRQRYTRGYEGTLLGFLMPPVALFRQKEAVSGCIDECEKMLLFILRITCLSDK